MAFAKVRYSDEQSELALGLDAVDCPCGKG